MVPTQFNENVKCTIHISVNIASNKLLHQEQIIFFFNLFMLCYTNKRLFFILFVSISSHVNEKLHSQVRAIQTKLFTNINAKIIEYRIVVNLYCLTQSMNIPVHT